MSSPTAEIEPKAPGSAHIGEPVIRVEHVSVRYRVPRERILSIKDYAIRKVKGQIVIDEFWALRDVSLEVRKGEILGVIGHNGAGKSTLLKLIARVQRPSSGRVRVRGRVAPLLELGAGFDPEMTGRENLFLNGTLLGFTAADIASRVDRMVDFAGLRDFIDRPLRTYSTGMSARLGFASATDVQPDILILDEVLGVGDLDFQKKCAARLEELRRHGDAIIMVSHNVAVLRATCHRVAWLHHGELRAVGDAAQVVDEYLRASAG